MNQRRRMWEAWERLHMLQEDRDICQRSGDGRKIAVKKMPKPKRPSPFPAVGTSKYLKKTSNVDDIRPSPTAAGSSMPSASPTTENRMQLHSLAMPMVEPLQPQLPQPWVDKKFPQPRTNTMSRVLPKLSVSPQLRPRSDPPYGQILIEDYRRWQQSTRGGK